MSESTELADQYEAAMAEVIALAKSCSDEEWQTLSGNEERTVGVLFDHIAQGNPQVVGWIDELLEGRPVEITREILNEENAEHARRAASRPRHETIEALETTTPRTAVALRSLTEQQLRRKQSFGWAGEQEVAWVAGAAIRHPRVHLKSIREALGRQ